MIKKIVKDQKRYIKLGKLEIPYEVDVCYDNICSFIQKEIGDEACSVDDIFTAFLAIGTMSVVRIVDIIFLRKKLPYFLEDG